MSKRSSILFGDGDSDEGDAPGSLDDVVAAAEAAYDAAQSGGAGADVEVDLTKPASQVADEVTTGEGDSSQETNDEPQEDEDTPREDDDQSDDEKSAEEPAQERKNRFLSHEEAERAYAEAQSHITNLEEQIARREALLERVAPSQVDHAQPTPSTHDLAAFAQHDPVNGFEIALAHGDHRVAEQVIARVSMDATTLAAQSMIAAEEGDQQRAQELQNQAISASSYAEELRSRKWQAEQQVREAPRVRSEIQDRVRSAAARVLASPSFKGVEMGAQVDSAVTQFIRDRPEVMGDWSPQAIERGMTEAYETVVFGSREKAIEHLVAQRVAEEVAKQLGGGVPTPQRRKARGTGGGTGRRAPQQTRSADDDEADEIRSSVSRRRPNGMGILFPQ